MKALEYPFQVSFHSKSESPRLGYYGVSFCFENFKIGVIDLAYNLFFLRTIYGFGIE